LSIDKQQLQKEVLMMTMGLTAEVMAGPVPMNVAADAPAARGPRANSRSLANAAMNRYALGDDDAFAELYPALAPDLRRYLLRQTRDASRAEDLLQQTMMQIHCARSRFALGADVFPWAFSIARRFLIDSIRWERREAARTRAVATTTPTGGTMSDDIVHSIRVLRTVQQELGRLPDSQREAFELIKNDGLSLREAAEALGTTVVAIKLRTHRAYVALRDAISDEDEDYARPASQRLARGHRRSAEAQSPSAH
jgi:RNA polymerase sigma-70 factor (ECF subfamily)